MKNVEVSLSSGEVYNLGEAGKTIRWYRRSFNMSQQELAKRLGTSHPLIVRWEKGVDGMTVKNLVKLAMVFGVSETELLHPSEEIKRWISMSEKKP